MTAQEARGKARQVNDSEIDFILLQIEDRVKIGSFILEFSPTQESWRVLEEMGYSVLQKQSGRGIRQYIWWGEANKNEYN